MMRIIFAVGLLFSTPAMAQESVFLENWKNQASYFWKMDFSDEPQFKQDLSNYYKSIYSDPILGRMIIWIESGSLESEHFSSRFKDLEETVLTSLEKAGPESYVAKTIQSSCYNTDYNPPIIETLVRDYKVSNYTQAEVDEWYSKIPFPRVDGELCLEVIRRVDLKLNVAANRIAEEKWTVLETKLVLMPNQLLNSRPKDGAN